MSDETFEDVFHAGVWVVGVDEIDIFRDVICVEILQWRDLDLGGIHSVARYVGGMNTRREVCLSLRKQRKVEKLFNVGDGRWAVT